MVNGEEIREDERQALRDMLEDARAELRQLREALGVSYEPHQSLHERMLEAARGAAAWRTLLDRADKDKPHMIDIGHVIEPIKRMRAWADSLEAETAAETYTAEYLTVRQTVFRWIVTPDQQTLADALRHIEKPICPICKGHSKPGDCSCPCQM
jgi:hypothetical protein